MYNEFPHLFAQNPGYLSAPVKSAMRLLGGAVTARRLLHFAGQQIRRKKMVSEKKMGSQG
jgi:hypothetical protein